MNADPMTDFDDLDVQSQQRRSRLLPDGIAACPPCRHSGTYTGGKSASGQSMQPDAMTHSAAVSSWFIWAVLSAVFAALTAIFAKSGLAGVDSDMAPLIRTVVILGMLGVVVCATSKWTNLLELSSRTLGFLVLSGLTTGARWNCYFRALQVGDASKIEPVDKLSLLLIVAMAFVFLGEQPSLPEWLGIAMIGAGVMVAALK